MLHANDSMDAQSEAKYEIQGTDKAVQTEVCSDVTRIHKTKATQTDVSFENLLTTSTSNPSLNRHTDIRGNKKPQKVCIPKEITKERSWRNKKISRNATSGLKSIHTDTTKSKLSSPTGKNVRAVKNTEKTTKNQEERLYQGVKPPQSSKTPGRLKNKQNERITQLNQQSSEKRKRPTKITTREGDYPLSFENKHKDPTMSTNENLQKDSRNRTTPHENNSSNTVLLQRGALSKKENLHQRSKNGSNASPINKRSKIPIGVFRMTKQTEIDKRKKYTTLFPTYSPNKITETTTTPSLMLSRSSLPDRIGNVTPSTTDSSGRTLAHVMLHLFSILRLCISWCICALRLLFTFIRTFFSRFRPGHRAMSCEAIRSLVDINGGSAVSTKFSLSSKEDTNIEGKQVDEYQSNQNYRSSKVNPTTSDNSNNDERMERNDSSQKFASFSVAKPNKDPEQFKIGVKRKAEKKSISTNYFSCEEEGQGNVIDKRRQQKVSFHSDEKNRSDNSIDYQSKRTHESNVTDKDTVHGDKILNVKPMTENISNESEMEENHENVSKYQADILRKDNVLDSKSSSQLLHTQSLKIIKHDTETPLPQDVCKMEENTESVSLSRAEGSNKIEKGLEHYSSFRSELSDASELSHQVESLSSEIEYSSPRLYSPARTTDYMSKREENSPPTDIKSEIDVTYPKNVASMEQKVDISEEDTKRDTQKLNTRARKTDFSFEHTGESPASTKRDTQKLDTRARKTDFSFEHTGESPASTKRDTQKLDTRARKTDFSFEHTGESPASTKRDTQKLDTRARKTDFSFEHTGESPASTKRDTQKLDTRARKTDFSFEHTGESPASTKRDTQKLNTRARKTDFSFEHTGESPASTKRDTQKRDTRARNTDSSFDYTEESPATKIKIDTSRGYSTAISSDFNSAEHTVLSEKFLNELSSNIGQDWIPLFINLGLTDAEIAHIDMDRAFDPRTKILKAFLKWRQKFKQYNATYQLKLLIAGFKTREIGRNDLAHKCFGYLNPKRISSISTKELTCDGEPDVSSLKRRLLGMNDNHTRKIPLSPVQKGSDRLPIEQLFSSVIIKEDTKETRKGKKVSRMGKSYDRKEVKSPEDLLTKNGKPVSNVFMLGDAAHGKTTYCLWLFRSWCNSKQPHLMGRQMNEWEKALSKFDFVFYVPFRQVKSSTADLKDMICHDILGTDTGLEESVRQVLTSEKYRCMIIMDGLDEWKPDQTVIDRLKYKGMPNIDNLSNCVIFTTMRSWKFADVAELVCDDDRVIEIEGLDDNGIKDVIEKVLINHYEIEPGTPEYDAISKEIISKLDNETVKSFIKIPLLAVVCVQIWYEGEQVGDSMTSFYIAMVNMLIQRTHLKYGTDEMSFETFKGCLPDILSSRRNIKNNFNVLLKLGKVAYEGLLSKEMKLVFLHDDLETEIGEGELQFALDVGLISQRDEHSIMEEKVRVHFFHKSLQEFLAAIYIVTKKEVGEAFVGQLCSVKVVMELSNVIMFLCGMSPSMGSDISKRLVQLTDTDRDILKYREKAGYVETVREVYKVQLSWYKEIQFAHTENPVTFHVSDVDLFHDSDPETVRVTKKFLSGHHEDIRSLWLQNVNTEGENGISDVELNEFLSEKENKQSLVKFSMLCQETDRLFHTMSAKSLNTFCLKGVGPRDP